MYFYLYRSVSLFKAGDVFHGRSISQSITQTVSPKPPATLSQILASVDKLSTSVIARFLFHRIPARKETYFSYWIIANPSILLIVLSSQPFKYSTHSFREYRITQKRTLSITFYRILQFDPIASEGVLIEQTQLFLWNRSWKTCQTLNQSSRYRISTFR